MRRILALLLMLALAAPLVAVVPVAHRITSYNVPGSFFIVQRSCVAADVDTIAGPSVACRGARLVEFLIRANQGTCSLLTVQVSMNDTTWAAPSSGISGIATGFTQGDSLNTGGVVVLFVGGVSTGDREAGIPYNFARAVVTPQAGTLASCASKLDSLRFIPSVSWNLP